MQPRCLVESRDRLGGWSNLPGVPELSLGAAGGGAPANDAAGRARWHESIAEMQVDPDIWLATYNTGRPHQSRGMNGRTPLQAFLEGLPPSATEAPPEDEIAA
ncbi:hypothetical protein [Marinimicrococcus flavescens]|uniref:Transposase n=1 Tax=Marinimicrococcus flavescens TaxID=3031815 RepID=A0AAP3XQD3_9PROT|nr:hypothetical protein [Marinimicrococcus flavescens]